MISAVHIINQKRGMTLIEITVAVIIVSVLSGLAIPKFLIHLERTRAAEAVQLLESLYKAQTAFFYENQAYTSTLTSLEIDIPALQSFNAPVVSTTDPIVSLSRSNGSYTIRISSTGVFSCIPAGTTCTKLGY
jgi:prepilin-type N-terminal cleavage/methylation domain-containing protein